MRILVVGGTRFFGIDAVRLLLEHGHDVTVLSRRELPGGLPGTPRRIAGDRNDAAVLDAVREASRQQAFDAVFDNVGMTAPEVRSLLDALDGRGGHYVFTSTGSIYLKGDHYKHLVESDDHLDDKRGEGQSEYADGKRAAEREIAGRAGLRWTVLRPTIVFGPGDPTGRLEYYVVQLLEGKPVGPTGFVFNPVFSRDVARLAVRVIEDPPPSGRAYNVAGRETVSVADICGRIKGILCIPGPGQDMPGTPEKPPLLPTSGRFELSIERAIQELGFDPTPLGSWLELTAGEIQKRWQK